MATEQVNPIDSPQVFDVVKIASVISPGICRVAGWKRPHGWDIKKGKGTKGSTSTLVTYPPAQGTITFYLWTAQHFIDWGVFRPLFKYDTTKKPLQAVDVWYPTLLDLDINSVVCDDIGVIEPVNDPPDGLFKCVVTLHEYFPPAKKPATSTPSSSQQEGGRVIGSNQQHGPPPATAQDDQQAQIAGLMKKAAAA